MKNNSEKPGIVLIDEELNDEELIKKLKEYNLLEKLTVENATKVTGVAFIDGKYLSYDTTERNAIGYMKSFDTFDEALEDAKNLYAANQVLTTLLARRKKSKVKDFFASLKDKKVK